MQRSLFTGVTGLSNHQSILDLTANNLANISTPGYKGSRLSFATALNQSTYSGSAPGSTQGGTNPRQVGLGVATSSIDIDTRQGALLATGRTLDLAIQGNGYFKVTKSNPNDGTFYTRVGNFGVDSNNDLLDLGTGLKVNGLQNNSEGSISLANSQSIDATATAQIKFQGNLDASTKALQGQTLTGVLPLVSTTTNAAADDGTLLRQLTFFKGTDTDPATALTGTTSISLAPASLPITGQNLITGDALQIGGRVRSTLTLPAVDITAGSLTFRVVDDTGATVSTATLSAPTSLAAASATARTLQLDSGTSRVQGGRTLSLVVDATAGTTLSSGTTYSVGYTSELVSPIKVFGTKPDGEVYAGEVLLNPWKDTVKDLVEGINEVLTQGSSAFAQVQLDNGSLAASSLTPGQSFSLFLGEKDILGSFSASTTSSYQPSALLEGSSTYPGNGVAAILADTTVTSTDDSSLVPTFTMPAADFSGLAFSGTNMSISVKVNGSVVGTVTIPAADYTTVNRQFTLNSFPLVKNGDQVTYEVTGTMNTGANAIGFNTSLSRLTADDGSALTPQDGYNYRGVSSVAIAGTSAAVGGMLEPTFTMPANDYSGQSGRALKIAIRVNGQERGSISIPAADYSGVAKRTFSLSGLPHVKAGDKITYDLSGTLDLGANTLNAAPPYLPTGNGNNLLWSTVVYPDSNANQMTSDRDGDSVADMFDSAVSENGSTLASTELVDVNLYQYHDDSNANFTWYRTRFTPSTVLSSIDVYDSQGTRHTVEGRFFKTGTGREGGAESPLINYWDMIANVDPTEGKLNADLVTGIRFDDKGRFLAVQSTTPRGNSVSSVSTAVSSSRSTVDVTWDAIGVESALGLDFGDASSTRGLTGFGTPSTAAAVSQDGFANGALESVSVLSSGDINGLYSNGQTKKIGAIQLYTFRNPAGLLAVGGNLWSTSSNSGQEVRRTPGDGGSGSITAGSLEGSNVDIASEFTRMITAQRGFQMNARVIQTTDSILQELAGLVR